MFYNKAKKNAISRLKSAEEEYARLGKNANDKAIELYTYRKSAALQIKRVEEYINTLANTPKEFLKDVENVRLNIREFNKAIEIEEENSKANIKGGSVAAGGIATGGAIAALGPTAAMAIATTFGTASTGTAISALSGAAATNAALAWLGGGAVAAGGGGMAAGNAILALAGPVGWTAAAVFAIGGGLLAYNKNKKAAEKATDEAIKVEKKIYNLKVLINGLNALKNKTIKLKSSLDFALMVNTYPKNYIDFSIEQKENLAALINNVRSMGELINERVS